MPERTQPASARTVDRRALLAAGGHDLPALRELAAGLAKEAGERLLAQRPDRVDVAATKSSSTDVVTAADRASETWLREQLARCRPDDLVLGEEFGGAGTETRTEVTDGAPDAREAGCLTWVLDPIDGTVNYLYGLPSWAVSVACVLGDPTRPGAWAPAVGAVYAPVTGELFHAGHGAGAVLETPPADGRAGERALRVAATTDPALALLGTGFGYDAGVRAEQGRVVAELLPQVRDIRRLGSAALDLCAVAAGRLDAYYERGTHVWDHAAGLLVVEEAGGVVHGPVGGFPGRSLLVAGPEPLVAWLGTRLDELGAAGPEG